MEQLNHIESFFEEPTKSQSVYSESSFPQTVANEDHEEVVIYESTPTQQRPQYRAVPAPQPRSDNGLMPSIKSHSRKINYEFSQLGNYDDSCVPGSCDAHSDEMIWEEDGTFYHEDCDGPWCDTGVPMWTDSVCGCPSCTAKRERDAMFPTINVSGFFQADSYWFNQGSSSRAALGDLQDITQFRRARLAASGQVSDSFAYMIEFDFAFQGRPTFMDLWVEAQDTALGDIRIGQFRQPFGMDSLTSVKELIFLERALPFILMPFRQTGVSLSHSLWDNIGSWGISAYRFQADPFGGTFGDRGYGTSSRMTLALWDYEQGHNSSAFHIGGSHSYNRPSTEMLQYQSPPEIGYNFGDINGSPFAVPFFVDTGAIPTRSLNLYGAETGITFCNWYAQAEYVRSTVNRSDVGNHSFQGAYGQLAWTMTGEHHPYDVRNGVFKRVVPDRPVGDGGIGAWEAAVRYSWLDLNDGAVTGGELDDLTFGLNWYLNKYTKMQFDYTRANLDRGMGHSNTNVFALRAQLDF